MFTGYSDATVDFMWGIRFNNERGWFLEHKQEYLDHLYGPTAALAKEVYEDFVGKYKDLGLELHISRIYRDARRLFGRGPYKDHLWFSLRRSGKWEEKPCFYFEISPEGYSYGMGFYSAKAATMEHFRKDLDQDAADFIAMAEKLESYGKYVINGEEYARKKGKPDGILEKWYNRKRIDIECRRPIDDLAYSPALRQEISQSFDELMPFFLHFQKLCDREIANQNA